MSGLLELFAKGAFNLEGSTHSRKVGEDLTQDFVAYNVMDGAAQELHNLISAPLPYDRKTNDNIGG